MTDRDRLLQIVAKAKKKTKEAKSDIERNMIFVDELIANGVFLLPEDLRGTEDFSVSAFIEAMQMHKEKDRYIKLPCKVGDRLYEIVEMNHTAHKHHNVFISDFPITVEPYQIVYRNIMGGYSCIPFDDFGKTVFLTKEEAEQKLKELKDNA